MQLREVWDFIFYFCISGRLWYLSVSLKNGPKNVSIVGAQIHRNDRNSFFAFYSFSWRNDGRKKMQRSFSSIYLSFLLDLTQFLATLHTNWQIEYWSDAAFSFSTLQKYCWWMTCFLKYLSCKKVAVLREVESNHHLGTCSMPFWNVQKNAKNKIIALSSLHESCSGPFWMTKGFRHCPNVANVWLIYCQIVQQGIKTLKEIR